MNSRTELLIGREAVEKLNNARILVAGLGGVGGYTVEGLARAGIGCIGICDFDRITVSNKNRQIYALDSTLGQLKTEVSQLRIHDINPECNVSVFSEKITPENIEQLLFSDYEWDYVADAIDDVPAKIELLTYCFDHSIPVISSMGTGNKLDPSKFIISDISKTNTCPLARKVRTELKRHGIEKGIKVLFSTEPATEKNVSVIPSISFVPSIAGLMIAGEIIKNLIA